MGGGFIWPTIYVIPAQKREPEQEPEPKVYRYIGSGGFLFSGSAETEFDYSAAIEADDEEVIELLAMMEVFA